MRKERTVVPNKQNEPLLPGWAKVLAAVAAIALATYILPILETPANAPPSSPILINLDDAISNGSCVIAGGYLPWLESDPLRSPSDEIKAIQKYYPNRNEIRVSLFRYTISPYGDYVTTCVPHSEECLDGTDVNYPRDGIVYCPSQ